MKKKDASFWSDIKALDERLTREPDSFCFARLSEIYLKVGLVADALHTARTGVAKHPGYLAGQRAMAMACNASGLHDESRVILEKVTAAMPEDVDALKILAGLYVAAGDTVSAIRTYRTVLDFKPDDRGSVKELDALQHGGTPASGVYSTAGQLETGYGALDEENREEEIIDLSESDIFEEPSEEPVMEVTSFEAAEGVSAHHDPLSTLTLAELYEKQGFLPKALAIYRTILADDPTNALLLAKIAQLEGAEPVSENTPEEGVVTGFDEETECFEPEAYGDVPVALEPLLAVPLSTVSEEIVMPELSAPAAIENVSASLESSAFAPLAHKTADNVVDTLDGWLENIRRIKACR